MIQVKKFSGAEYKGFNNIVDARKYLQSGKKLKQSTSGSIKNTMQSPYIINGTEMKAYVDGSYNSKLKIYGSGIVVIINEIVVKMTGFCGNQKKYLSLENTSGEIFATIYAISYAISQNIKTLHIYYDCDSVVKWTNEDAKLNHSLALKYRDFVRKNSEIIELVFHKVKSHSGDKYNEIADNLARASANC